MQHPTKAQVEEIRDRDKRTVRSGEIRALAESWLELHEAAEQLRKDAARWQWVRRFIVADDVGDDCFAWGLVVLNEKLENAAGVTDFKETVEQIIDDAIASEAGK